MEFTAKTIAEFLKGTVEGNPDVAVTNVSPIEDGKKGTLSFLANPKYAKHVYSTEASIVLVSKDFNAEQEVNTTLVRVEDAYQAFAMLLDLYQQSLPQKSGIESKASIHESATIGENCYVGDFAYIGENSTIGNNVKIYPQVYIGDNVKVEDDCILYPWGESIHGNFLLERIVLFMPDQLLDPMDLALLLPMVVIRKYPNLGL